MFDDMGYLHLTLDTCAMFDEMAYLHLRKCVMKVRALVQAMIRSQVAALEFNAIVVDCFCI